MRLPTLTLPMVLSCALATVGMPTHAHAGSSLIGPAPEPDDEDEDLEDATLEEPAASPAEQKAQKQIVLGAVLGSFGIIFTLVGAGLLGVRATAEINGEPDRARKNGIAALVFGVAGLGLTATGATFLGLGLKKRSRLRAKQTRFTISPMLARHGAGAGLSLEF